MGDCVVVEKGWPKRTKRTFSIKSVLISIIPNLDKLSSNFSISFPQCREMAKNIGNLYKLLYKK
jgi:hypothetical protein